MRCGSHLPLLSLLATLVLVGVAPAVGEDQPAWDVTLKPDFQARSTLTVNNRCIRRHTFTVTKENLPFIHFLAEPKLSVPAKSSHQLPIQFDTTGMKAGEYQGVVVVTCVSCGNEPTCTQDRERLPVNLTVTAPRATPAEPATEAPGEPGSRPTSTRSREPSAAQPTPQPEQESSGLEAVIEKLEQINQLIDEATQKYENDEIEEEELVNYLREMMTLRREAMDLFPDIWGRPFSFWQGHFGSLGWILTHTWGYAGDPGIPIFGRRHRFCHSISGLSTSTFGATANRTNRFSITTWRFGRTIPRG